MSIPHITKIDGQHVVRPQAAPDIEAAALAVGWQNWSRVGIFDVLDRLAPTVPDGFKLVWKFSHPTAAVHAEGLPDERVRIGQVKIRTSDPEIVLYIVRS